MRSTARTIWMIGSIEVISIGKIVAYVIIQINMKTLVIGIFSIVVVGVLFFAFQVVRNVGFTDVTKVTATAPKDKDTFIDINRNISFDYPKGWTMHDPALVPGYAPILKSTKEAGDVGFIALSISPLKKNENVASDIEIYSSELTIHDALLQLIDAPLDTTIDIEVKEVKRLTYKSGLSGFLISYSAKTLSKNFEGTVYYYYTRNGIEYAFSSYITDILIASAGNLETAGAENASQDKMAAQHFLTQAHESLTNIVTY